MSKIEQRPTITSECVIRLTEAEMQGLEMLTTYGIDSLMKMVGNNYSDSDVKRYGAGVRSFFEGIGDIEGILIRTKDARAVFTGDKVAIDREIKS